MRLALTSGAKKNIDLGAVASSAVPSSDKDNKDNKDNPECALGLGECTLDCLAHGQKGRVALVDGPNRCRLMELGFTNGTEVEVCRRAAFGGPVEVRLRSYRLSLRLSEASAIHLDTNGSGNDATPSLVLATSG